MLSIDIGKTNLGYSILENDNLTFDMFTLDDNKSKDNLVMKRTRKMSEFIDAIFMKHDITTVIIERQVPNNTICMELMYLLAGVVYQYCPNIIIFDPKLKFTLTKLPYNTKNKAHKKLSIHVMHEFLKAKYPDKLELFKRFKKQDDISDSLFMLFVEYYKNDKEMLMFINQLV